MLQQLLGEGVGDQQLERVVQATMLQYDTDGDWRLDFREFVALMNRWAALAMLAKACHGLAAGRSSKDTGS